MNSNIKLFHFQNEENGHDPAGDKSVLSRTDMGDKQTRYRNNSFSHIREVSLIVSILQYDGTLNHLVLIDCSSIIDEISRKVQALVEKINDSRTSDQRVMDSFQDELMTKVWTPVKKTPSGPRGCWPEI